MAVGWLWRRMTPLDRAVVLALFGAAAATFFLLGQRARGERVVVEQGGRVVFTAPLREDRTVVIPGPLGETVVAIRGGRACVVSASCPNKVCMGMGAAARQGELIACVPNALLLRVEGAPPTGTRDYDLLSR